MISRKKKKDNMPDINPNEKINYNEFDLLDGLINRAFQSFALTLDTENYVPASFIDEVCVWIYKLERKRFKKLKKSNKLFQKWFKENFPQLVAERQKKQFDEQVQELRAQEQSSLPVVQEQAAATNVPDDRGQRSE